MHYGIDTARDFVLNPLHSVPGNARLKRALAAYQAAPPSLQSRWTDAYTAGLKNARFPGGLPVLPPGRYGPVAPMMSSLAGLAQSGGLDGALLTTSQFYQTNYTKPLLFLSGGGYFESRAEGQHLLGDQWGMMNETGSYPGQVWLWLYTFWYQISPFNTSENADAADLGDHGRAQPGLRMHSLHSRDSTRASLSRRSPVDLARPLSAGRGRSVAAMAARSRFTAEEARRIGEEIGIDWSAAPFDVAQFRTGLDVELEHGAHDPGTDVTGDDPTTTGKIALAHLNEFPDYYTRLEEMEQQAKRDHGIG